MSQFTPNRLRFHASLVPKKRTHLPERERPVAIALSGNRFEGPSGKVPPLLLEAAGQVVRQREGHVHGGSREVDEGQFRCIKPNETV
jgi:hypothetical protein